MCAVLYCSPEQLSATFVAGRNDHRSDIACATRLREGVCTKAPEHIVNIAREKRTGFGSIALKDDIAPLTYDNKSVLFQPMHRAFGRYSDKSLITAFLCRSDALSPILP
jgi:hypothetical protein